MATTLTLIRSVRRALLAKSLTAPVRRAVVGQLFHGFSRAGVTLPSGSALLSQLRANNLGIRTQDFFRLFNTFKEYDGKVSEQLTAPDDKRVLIKNMPTTAFHSRTRFQYKIVAEVVPYGEDEFETREFWFGSNDQLSPNEAVEGFFAQHLDKFGEGNIDVESAKFGGALQRGRRF